MKTANGARTLLSRTEPVKQKSRKNSPARKTIPSQAQPPRWEDSADGLQLDLETEITATIGGLYLLRAMFNDHILHRVTQKHPLTEYHLGNLCSHLLVGLNTALDRVQVLRQETGRKGGQQ